MGAPEAGLRQIERTARSVADSEGVHALSDILVAPDPLEGRDRSNQSVCGASEVTKTQLTSSLQLEDRTIHAAISRRLTFGEPMKGGFEATLSEVRARQEEPVEPR